MKKVDSIKPDKYAEVYELAKSGLSDKDIAERFGMKKSAFRRIKTEDKAVGALVASGREQANPRGAAHGDFESYVYGQLDPRAKAHWDKIMEVWKSPKDKLKGVERREALQKVLQGTANTPKHVRQGLFVHAWIKTGFNGTKASALSGVPYRTYMSWVKYDPHFQHLLEEVDWHRKNFFESALIKLVRQGNPAAVIHVAKSQLVDRGYGTKVQFEGSMQHTHEDKVSVEDLGLSVEVRKQLLKAIEKKARDDGRKALKAHDPDVIDAEVVSVRGSKPRKPSASRK